MTQSKLRPTQSRYDLRGASPPAGEALGRPAPSVNIRTAVGAVDDPLSRDRRLATVNRRVDVLEWERSHDRISEAAYREGRILQRAYEVRSRIGPGSVDGMMGRSQTADQKAAAMHGRLADTMDKSGPYLAWVARELGEIDARLLRQVIGDGLGFAEVAALRGRGNERGVAYFAQRCRDALEALAEKRAAHGRWKV
jgi:hypothetical protein